MPCRVERTAEAEEGWRLPGAVGLARAGMCSPPKGAERGFLGRAGQLRVLVGTEA